MPTRESPMQSEMPGHWTCARSHHCARHRARVRSRAANRARVSLPGPSPAGGSRLDRVVLGHLGQQPQGEVLPVDPDRPQTTRRADHAVGRDRSRHRQDPQSVNGVSTSRQLSTSMSFACRRRSTSRTAMRRASFNRFIGVMSEGFRFLDMEPAAEVIGLLPFDHSRTPHASRPNQTI
jgi:hypothetical protein